MAHTEQFFEYLVVNKMIVNDDVVNAGMENWIFTQVRCPQIVIVDGWYVRKGDGEFL